MWFVIYVYQLTNVIVNVQETPSKQRTTKISIHQRQVKEIVPRVSSTTSSNPPPASSNPPPASSNPLPASSSISAAMQEGSSTEDVLSSIR